MKNEEFVNLRSKETKEKENEMNLLEETLNVLSDNGYSPDDILYVTNGRSFITWSEFEESSRDLNYDNGYGGHEISLDLKIVSSTYSAM